MSLLSLPVEKNTSLEEAIKGEMMTSRFYFIPTASSRREKRKIQRFIQGSPKVPFFDLSSPGEKLDLELFIFSFRRPKKREMETES